MRTALLLLALLLASCRATPRPAPGEMIIYPPPQTWSDPSP